jgi:glycosyltransferase involved in cell wall biosynthesis
MTNDLHVLYSFPGRVGCPGIGTTAFYQISTLIQKGVRVFLFCGSCEKKIENLSFLHQTYKYMNIKIPMRIFGRRAGFFHDQIVARKLLKFKDQIDVIHSWPGGSLETLKRAKQYHIKTFLERPNTDTRFAFEVVRKEYEKLGIPMPSSSSHTYNKMTLNREEKEYEVADYLLCPSDFVKKTFLDKGYDEKRLKRHQYGYDPNVFWYSQSEHKKANEFRLIYVGTCEPRKGLHYALEAWLNSEASNYGSFVICGGFISKEYKKYLHGFLSHPSVKYLGFQANVLSFMQESHALILPTIEEGSALVTYEARAAGCVLLVSKASGALCEDGYDSLVHDVGDVKALTRHIDQLFLNPACYQAMHLQSLQSSRELTWLKATCILLDIYHNAMP